MNLFLNYSNNATSYCYFFGGERMKKVELLAPAGDQESLIAAIQNGADAIYLGGTLFNARAFAKNFDDEQLECS